MKLKSSKFQLEHLREKTRVYFYATISKKSKHKTIKPKIYYESVKLCKILSKKLIFLRQSRILLCVWIIWVIFLRNKSARADFYLLKAYDFMSRLRKSIYEDKLHNHTFNSNLPRLFSCQLKFKNIRVVKKI